jgi:cytochrome c553
MKNILFILATVLGFLSCKNQSNEDSKYLKLSSAELNSEEIAVKGKTLMENKCYLCHSPKASKDSRVGPPMIALKKRYLRDAETKEDFIVAIWNFVEKPTPEKAKLKGAVERFGLMPYQPYQQQDIEAIASFMYDYQIDQPEWFDEHWEEEHGGKRKRQRGKAMSELPTPEESYADIGMSYAKSTKQTLGKNLMGAMQKEGVMHALEFCNVQAMPLTDSMATKHKASIKRVSDKNRNPSNTANKQELEYISFYKEIVANGEEPEPIVMEEDEKVNFYYPIVTNDMCLKCHGTPDKQMERETYSKIKELYPNDKAIGYDVNEVRGIWSISFDKE